MGAMGFDTDVERPTQPPMLATVHFVNSTSKNNGQSRYYTREKYLLEKVASREHVCSRCRRVIVQGERYAVGVYSRYCMEDFALMSEDEAFVQSDVALADDETMGRLLGQPPPTPPIRKSTGQGESRARSMG